MNRCAKIILGMVAGMILVMTLTLNMSRKGHIFNEQRDLSEIRQSGRLRVVTEKSSLGFKLYNDQIEGFQYELVKAFADSLGLELEINPENNIDSAIAGILENRYDLIAMNLPNTSEIKKKLAVSIPIISGRQMLVQQEIIDTTNVKAIRNHHLLTEDSICIPVRSPFRQRLENLSNEIADSIKIVEIPAGQLSGELKIKKRDSAGYVTELTIGETLLEGESFAAGMGLESANFSLKKKDDIYYLRVRGSGHGVGFSQFGGNEMAKNGSSAEEILKRYFPEMELKAED